jgi:alpha-tubulin suppressor-like RCC1 family protein
MSVLLLIDVATPQYEAIRDAAKPNVTTVLFDSRTDSLSGVLGKIPAGSYATAGLVQEGSEFLPAYRIVQQQAAGTVAGVKEADPTLSSWSELIQFFTALKTQFGVQAYDFISCMMLSNPEFAWVLSELQTRVDVDFRASSDMTGNLVAGGNWMQESDGVDIKDIYFTEAIAAYTRVLYYVSTHQSREMLSASRPVHGMVRDISSMQDWYTFDSPYDAIAWGYGTRRISPLPIKAVNTRFMEFGITVDDQLVQIPLFDSSGYPALTEVMAIATTYSACAAIKTGGSVIVWNRSPANYNNPSDADISGVANELSAGVIAIASTNSSFAALRSDGRVITWGNTGRGGNSSSVASHLLSGVVAITGNDYAFAALKSDGSVVTWGDSSYGGNSSSVASSLSSGVVAITSNLYAFAALKSNGSVITWGDVTSGGNSSAVASSLTSGVVAIAKTAFAFAALKSDGSVISWGASNYGGDSSTVASSLTSGVVSITSNNNAFAALKSGGSVIVWGTYYSGGYPTFMSATSIQRSDIIARLSSGVTDITATNVSFAALKTDGSVVAWGDQTYGGNSLIFDSDLSANITHIASASTSLAAMNSTGKIISWATSQNTFPTDISNSGFRNIIGGSGPRLLATRTAVMRPPTLLSLNGGISSITVSWTAPVYDGGATITDYTLYWTGTSSGNTSLGSTPMTNKPVTLAAGTYDFYITATNSAGEGPASSTVTGVTVTSPPVNNSPVPCFLAGAPVLTPAGYRRIEELTEGDLVTTGDGRQVPIQRVKRTLVTAGPSVDPYVIPKGRFGATRRLLISPNHKVQTDDGMQEVRHLGLRQEEQSGQFVYYNLELPEWGRDTLVVAGVTCESLAPVRRVAMPLAVFKALLTAKYGAVTPSVLEKVMRTCRMMPDGTVEAPVMRR